MTDDPLSLGMGRSGFCKLSTCHLMHNPLSQNLYNCAFISNGQNSSQSFLKGCFRVIVLSLARIKFSISFLDGLINVWSSTL